MDGSSTSPLTPAEHPRPRRPSGQVGRWIAVACAVLLVLGPLAIMALPPEIARWYRAAAEEAALDEDYEGAIGKLDEALRWNPDDPMALIARARFKLQLRDLSGSLADTQRALDLGGDDFLAGRAQRMLVYQRMGEHEKAIADASAIVDLMAKLAEISESANLAYADALNARAYARALGEIDIEKGLEDIQQAFELLGTEDNAAFLDTRGYLYYLAGQMDNALRDMERSVQLAEDDRSAIVMRRVDRIRSGVDERQVDESERLAEQNLAVLYQHRGLVYEKLGRSNEATEDFRRAQEYGYSPEDGVW
jgi:tetratricopeptide (TPR) repeat protein